MDFSGEVLWLGARAVPKLSSVLETEAEALRWEIYTNDDRIRVHQGDL